MAVADAAARRPCHGRHRADRCRVATAGYAAAVWPGRLELLAVAGRDVLLDGAHNPAGAAALAESPSTISGRSWPPARSRSSPPRWPTRTSTASSRRSRRAVPLAARPSSAPASTSRGQCRPRRWPLAGSAASRSPGAWSASDPTRGPRRALSRSPRDAGPVVVAGSLYLVGAARGRLVDDPACAIRGPDPDRAHAVTASAQPIGPTRIGRPFRWGERTFVMGIINVTPDSFSGDGVLAAAARTGDAVESGGRPGRASMVADGADILDVGGESTRPGHQPVARRRGAAAGRAGDRAPCARRCPRSPISVDTTKPAVAEAALAAGADLINDVWGVGSDDALPRLAAAGRVPLVVMHNRAEPRYERFLPEVSPTCEAALERAVRLGVRLGRPDRRSRASASARRPSRTCELAARTRARSACLGRPDPARHEPQVDPGPGPRPRPATSASRRPSRPPRWRSPAASTSSASMTSAPTSARRASPMRSCAGTGGANPPKEGHH